MFNSVQKLTVTFVTATSLASVSSLAMAAPVTNASAIRNAMPSAVETVRWWGWGAPAAAFVAGGLIGGALAAPHYYGYGPYYPGPYYSGAYYPAPYYPGPGPYAAAPAYSGAGEGDEGYCAQRFRSYDPSTGTYLGYDGQRHPCP
jgi:BA14K-like protein